MKIEISLIRLRLTQDPVARRKLLQEIRKATLNHLDLEEDVFYPAAEQISSITKWIEHARTDHQLVRIALSSLEAMKPDSERFNSLVIKLIIELERHVMEEENTIFPAVKRTLERTEFARLTTKVLERQQELQERPSVRKAA